VVENTPKDEMKNAVLRVFENTTNDEMKNGFSPESG
jgi:hypothetical protein